MNIIYNILLTFVISVLGATGVYQFAPLSFFEGTPKLGTSITTINGTDTISGSRTTINNNFTALNNGKIEVGTTSVSSITTMPNLESVGTITTGVWSGTALTWAKGGNASTTLSVNQVLLGNTTSGFKVVSGYGTAGQVLTSAGSGSAPTWSSGAVDTTIDYNWTGTNRFKNLHASSTAANPIVLNGVSYDTPSTQGGAGKILQNDGSGHLSWGMPARYSLISQTDVTAVSGWATSTLLSVPATTMTASSTIQVRGTIVCFGGSANIAKIVNLSGTPFVTTGTIGANCGTSNKIEEFVVDIYPNNATNSQTSNWHGVVIATSGSDAATNGGAEGTSAFDLAQAFSIGIAVYSDGNGQTLQKYSITVNP